MHEQDGILLLTRTVFVDELLELFCACVCLCVTVYADGMREAWRNVVEVMLHLHGIGALPDDVVDVDDFRSPNGNKLPSLGKGLRNKLDPRIAPNGSCLRRCVH
jgi:hypothetical protein